MADRSRIFALFNEIGIINQLSSAAFAKVLPKGMTIAQFSLLNHFVRLELKDQSPKDLASAFQVTRATMTSTLTRMKNAGLVTIHPNPDDGRGKLVSITKRGRSMRETCIEMLQSPIDEVDSVFDSGTINELLPLLTLVREELDRLRG